MSLAIAGYALDWADRDWRPVGLGAKVPDRTHRNGAIEAHRKAVRGPMAVGEGRRRFPLAKVGDRFGVDGDFVVVALLEPRPGRSDERVEIRCTNCDEPTRKVNVATMRHQPAKCIKRPRRHWRSK